MSDPGKGHWRDMALNVTDTLGYHETVDNQSTLHSLLKAINQGEPQPPTTGVANRKNV